MANGMDGNWYCTKRSFVFKTTTRGRVAERLSMLLYGERGNMKSFRNLLLIFFIIITGGSCDKEEAKNDKQNNLIGIWTEFYPSQEGTTLTFFDNGDFSLKEVSDSTIYTGKYQMISEDSIQMERLWEVLNLQQTKYKILFFSNDHMKIEKFYCSEATVFPPKFIDIELIKIE